MSDDGSFDFSTGLFHVTMSHGKSVQAPIRLYYLPRLKLSSSTLALVRDERLVLEMRFVLFENVAVLLSLTIYTKNYIFKIMWHGDRLIAAVCPQCS